MSQICPQCGMYVHWTDATSHSCVPTSQPTSASAEEAWYVDRVRELEAENARLRAILDSDDGFVTRKAYERDLATVRAQRDRMLLRLAKYNAVWPLLPAPCLWCGYNGAGYWQVGAHREDCRWVNVGGVSERTAALSALADQEEPKP